MLLVCALPPLTAPTTSECRVTGGRRDADAQLERAVAEALKQASAAASGAGAVVWGLCADYYAATGFRASAREAALKQVCTLRASEATQSGPRICMHVLCNFVLRKVPVPCCKLPGFGRSVAMPSANVGVEIRAHGAVHLSARGLDISAGNHFHHSLPL